MQISFKFQSSVPSTGDLIPVPMGVIQSEQNITLTTEQQIRDFRTE
jgi:hypothetical protein